MLSEESMMHVFSVGIEVIDHDIGVAGVTGSEDYHFEVLAEVSKDLPSIWSNVYARLEHLSIGELDGKTNCAWWMWRVIAMNEGFIEVKYYCLAV